MTKSIKSFKALFFTLLGLILLSVVIFLIKQRGYFFTYQVSGSMPKGLYLVMPITKIKYGDIVLFYPPRAIDKFLLAKHWVPDSGILMKKVLGMPGDFVCKKNKGIWLNHKLIAPIYKYYAPHKLLPNYHFCGIIKDHQYLLMSTLVTRSYDGRYFGLINRKQIIGKAKFLGNYYARKTVSR